MTTQTISKNKQIDFLDCPLHCFTLDQTLDEIERIISVREPTQHCVLNAGKIYLMNKNKELADIVRSCQIIQADGMSIVWAGRFLRLPKFPRVTGIDLMGRIFSLSNQKKYRIFFLGAKQDVLDRVLQHVETNYPDLVVAGAHHGYFQESDNDAVVNQIAASKADILMVAMGSPKKEYWISKNLKKMNVPFCMGVGGSFDVLAGKAKRAPQWIQNIGMEWFYRLVQEPRRLWRRYCVGNFFFISLVLRHAFKKAK